MSDGALHHFDGATFEPSRDARRLTNQFNRVLAALRDGREYTLSELHEITGDPEASISARLRDLRKPRFGSHEIRARYIRRGLFGYRLIKRDLFE